ncbi:hypothetical protein GCM10025879_20430 [Leuconostoc litchii]|uniref:Uncharacterized protein n=1 Tax=Leuconostoc litchii TaxID=1981069 RepID=A0A6P2CN66_9LACO|nr:hypothetical protein [Leuconostoc litchii]TYC46833.1 hypothetical protein ESZ47_01445 [Leuconostoc litchii]GMA70727.1 hypothetical protein GCM10025879_19730 [Leuconostoc litchii]GMA70797.1 hypothetical protein GCM10025879_20430 [Leuconostoc litchii]
MNKNIVMNEFEQPKLEILIGKLNESVEVAVDLASGSPDDDLVAELDTTAYELGELIHNLRQINKEATVHEYITGEI